VLKLHPLPAARLTAFAALPDLPAANALLARARGLCGASLTAFEVMGASCLQHLAQLMPQVRLPLPLAAPWFALLEISDSESEAHGVARLESVLETALAAGEVSDAVVAQSLAEAAALWQVRESIPEAHARSGGNVKHDISLPVSAIPEFVASTNARLAERFEWIWPSVFGHLGDGNLHYNMGTRPGVPVATAFAHEPEIRRLVHDAVAARGGSISAEHGIGQLKREELALYKSPVELALMRAIKHALDPQGLMNPGKLLP
jgi:FAD/FMN-containing dehydrogenase